MADSVNTATIDLICAFEGFVGHWYPDSAKGWAVPTAMYGHTDAAGEPKFASNPNARFTQADGRATLARDLERVAAQVRVRVHVTLNANELGALVSFVYNVGAGNFEKSTLLRKLNTGDRMGAANEFGKWIYSGGKKLRGLERRRAAEKELFLTLVGVQPTTPVPDLPPSLWARLFAWFRR